jgi:hypothetical protein
MEQSITNSPAQPTDTPTGLVVPVDMLAFCVSESDAVGGTPYFAGATVDYAALNQTNPDAYVGAAAARTFDFNPLHALEEGVHLHWALPDALTQGRTDEATPLHFPAAPNRWLITRFVIAGTTVTQTSFVVESDALSADNPGHWAPVLPVQGSGGQPVFNYVGLHTPLADYAGSPGGTAFAEAAGSPLSAVTNGTAQFAAFYPEGRASFGFLDTLSDLSGDAELLYVVTGWYAEAENDPASILTLAIQKAVAAQQTPPTFASLYGWGGGDGGAAEPGYTLYSGMAQGISWQPEGSYVVPPENTPTITADAAIATTPAEALAAYFRNILHPSLPTFEQILTAFQMGLWNDMAQPTPDMLANLADKLHSSQFKRADSILIWSIFQTDPNGTRHEAIGLPLMIADALNDANSARQQLLAVTEHVATFQWQAFADWYRWFNESDPNEQTAIFNHFGEVLLPIWNGPNNDDGLQAALTAAQQTRQDSDTSLQDLVKKRSDLSLREVPGPRYWQPADPVVLLAGDGLGLSARYGGDHEHSDTGLLLCRTTAELVSSVTIGGATRDVSGWADATRLSSNALPYLADCEALLGEALLLDTLVASSWSGTPEPGLQTDLKTLLAGGTQGSWTIAAGQPPSPVAVNWWEGENPWVPLFLQWQTEFVPLQPTIEKGALTDYTPQFFSANYSIDATTGSFVRYTPQGPDSITIDPAAQTYCPTYSGPSMLSDASPVSLAGRIETYLSSHSDATLQAVLNQLESTSIVVQPMSGFTAALVNQVLQVQFSLVVPTGASMQAQLLTTATAGIVGSSYAISPSFTNDYNPIRAGYLKFAGYVVDAFGQRRQIKIRNLYTAESTTTYTATGTAEPGIAYIAPRIAQGSRLLFAWMSAGQQAVEQLTQEPGISPVCGWIMPNHLTGGFFLYDATGEALGALQLNGLTPPQVAWQGAPGGDATIDEPIEQALADANPLLQQVALSLYYATPDFFHAFFVAVDTTHGMVNPQQLSTNSGLSVLAGRPVALVQAALKLDLCGRPLMNQNFACLSASEWIDTENGLSGVRFPVLLGDADRLDDGLVGFYRQTDDGTGFDLTTFFSEGAAAGAATGVVQPDASTVQLTLTPTMGDPDPPPTEIYRVLMLVDPRAPVHAVTGVLPTETLAIPADVAAAALSSLEFYFLAAPVLKPASVLAMPVPATPSGFDLSFVEQMKLNGAPEWVTLPDISPTTTGAVWDYTPQSLTEGWLRINPVQLGFALTNSAGKATVTAGAAQDLTLSVANDKPNTITFNPGTLAPEGTPPQGSVFYIHFGSLVAQADVPAIGFSARGWQFAPQQDDIYGAYWSATPTAPVQLVSGISFAIQVSGLKVTAAAGQVSVFFNYYGVDGAASGVFTDMVVVTTKGAAA